MYRHCISCSAEQGANEALEAFPVGRSMAFDAARGRLWALCPKCARWNLSPIEERWEAVEAAERLFVDARLRVQSENVGMAKLRDGTRLIRVGAALPGELAAWRWGGQLQRRRRGYLLAVGAAAAAGLAVVGGRWRRGWGSGCRWAPSTSRTRWSMGGGGGPTGASFTASPGRTEDRCSSAAGTRGPPCCAPRPAARSS